MTVAVGTMTEFSDQRIARNVVVRFEVETRHLNKRSTFVVQSLAPDMALMIG